MNGLYADTTDGTLVLIEDGATKSEKVLSWEEPSGERLFVELPIVDVSDMILYRKITPTAPGCVECGADAIGERCAGCITQDERTFGAFAF